MRLALASVVVALLVACSGGDGGLSGGTGKKGQKKVDPDDEDEKATEPTMVAGAFLTCGPDGEAKPGKSEPYGCRLQDKDGTKMAGKLEDVRVNIYRKDTGALRPQVKAEEEGANWHVRFKATAGTGANLDHLTVEASWRGAPILAETKSLKGDPGSEALGNAQAGTTAAGTPTADEKPVADDGTVGHIVFISSMRYEPGASNATHFNSVADADAKCTGLAATVKPPLVTGGTWRAIISSLDAPANVRIKLNGPVRDVKKQLVHGGSLQGPLTRTITLDENGTPRMINAYVWTGSNADGSAAQTCVDWKEGDEVEEFDGSTRVALGTQGVATSTTQWLSDGVMTDCGSLLDSPSVEAAFHLYCISQP